MYCNAYIFCLSLFACSQTFSMHKERAKAFVLDRRRTQQTAKGPSLGAHVFAAAALELTAAKPLLNQVCFAPQWNSKSFSWKKPIPWPEFHLKHGVKNQPFKAGQTWISTYFHQQNEPEKLTEGLSRAVIWQVGIDTSNVAQKLHRNSACYILSFEKNKLNKLLLKLFKFYIKQSEQSQDFVFCLLYKILQVNVLHSSWQ